MHVFLRLGATALLAACGLPAVTDYTPPPPQAPAIVTVDTVGGTAPRFAMYREGLDGPWQVPTRTATGYRIDVHDVYTFVSVCTTNGIAAQFYHATVSDGLTAQVSCATPGWSAPSERIMEVPVAGTMVQPGMVSVGADTSYYEQSAASNWSYLEYVEDSIYDVIATTTDHVEVMRDLAPAEGGGTTSLPALDVDGTGVAFAAISPSGVTSPTRSRALLSYAYTTANGAQLVSTAEVQDAGNGAIQVVPASILQPGDQQQLAVTFGADTTNTVATATSTSYGVFAPVIDFDIAKLPEPSALELGFDAGGAVATAALPDVYDQVSLVATNASATQSFFATRAWVDQTGVDTFSFDTGIPGYDPSWVVPFGGDSVGSFAVDLTYTDRGTGIVYQTTTR
jgi:hypothetical protein